MKIRFLIIIISYIDRRIKLHQIIAEIFILYEEKKLRFRNNSDEITLLVTYPRVTFLSNMIHCIDL